MFRSRWRCCLITKIGYLYKITLKDFLNDQQFGNFISSNLTKEDTKT